MGKASKRRKQSRQRYLARLAKENPSRFREEWMKRLACWEDEIDRKADTLVCHVSPETTVFAFADDVMEELVACGEVAVRLVGATTRQAMENACSRAISRVLGVPYRMNGPMRASKKKYPRRPHE